MSCRLFRLVVAVGLFTCLVTVAPTVGRAAGAAEKKPAPPAVEHAAPLAPVNVNVIVNVRVSHDTKVDVKIEAPFMPVIGSVQLPDFVQHFLGGFFKPVAKDAPAKPGESAPRAK